MMKPAYKIEMYDAGVVLFCEPQGVEFTGWDYGDGAYAFDLSGFGLDLLKEAGVIDEEQHRKLEGRETPKLVRKTLVREVHCLELTAEETANGLRVSAQVFGSWQDSPTAKGKGREEFWWVTATYKGNYTVFWDE